jgi:hypothetical protein
MKTFPAMVAVVVCVSASVSEAQTAPTTPAPTDVYHVLFAKAVPGQAAALQKQLQEQDPKDPMASHYILLRHQEGADWDFCLIQHLGRQTTVQITAPPASATSGTPALERHEDAFVAGPSWAEFQKTMDFAGSGNAVYVIGLHRPVPGHRSQLEELLRRPDAKSKAAGSAVLVHLEGGPWTFMSIDRYSSWQDFAADRSTASAGTGWLDTRQHSASHTDTIADRVR